MLAFPSPAPFFLMQLMIAGFSLRAERKVMCDLVGSCSHDALPVFAIRYFPFGIQLASL